jgi:uncharacterized membrane protein
MLETILALSFLIGAIALNWVILVVVGLILIVLAIALKRWEPPEVHTILWVVGIVLIVIGIIVLVV